MAGMTDEEFGEYEDTFHETVRAALLRDEDTNGKMVCPICGQTMEVLRRGERITVAGLEEPCIQYHCNECLMGGEMAS